MSTPPEIASTPKRSKARRKATDMKNARKREARNAMKKVKAPPLNWGSGK